MKSAINLITSTESIPLWISEAGIVEYQLTTQPQAQTNWFFYVYSTCSYRHVVEEKYWDGTEMLQLVELMPGVFFLLLTTAGIVFSKKSLNAELLVESIEEIYKLVKHLVAAALWQSCLYLGREGRDLCVFPLQKIQISQDCQRKLTGAFHSVPFPVVMKWLFYQHTTLFLWLSEIHFHPHPSWLWSN